MLCVVVVKPQQRSHTPQINPQNTPDQPPSRFAPPNLLLWMCCCCDVLLLLLFVLCVLCMFLFLFFFLLLSVPFPFYVTLVVVVRVACVLVVLFALLLLLFQIGVVRVVRQPYTTSASITSPSITSARHQAPIYTYRIYMYTNMSTNMSIYIKQIRNDKIKK